MPTSKEYIDYVLDILSRIGDFQTKKMMGEYCLYYKGKLIGEVCDNRVLIKKTPSSISILSGCKEEYPYVGSKQLLFLVDVEDNRVNEDLFEKMILELKK